MLDTSGGSVKSGPLFFINSKLYNEQSEYIMNTQQMLVLKKLKEQQQSWWKKPFKNQGTVIHTGGPIDIKTIYYSPEDADNLGRDTTLDTDKVGIHAKNLGLPEDHQDVYDARMNKNPPTIVPMTDPELLKQGYLWKLVNGRHRYSGHELANMKTFFCWILTFVDAEGIIIDKDGNEKVVKETANEWMTLYQDQSNVTGEDPTCTPTMDTSAYNTKETIKKSFDEKEIKSASKKILDKIDELNQLKGYKGDKLKQINNKTKKKLGLKTGNPYTYSDAQAEKALKENKIIDAILGRFTRQTVNGFTENIPHTQYIDAVIKKHIQDPTAPIVLRLEKISHEKIEAAEEKFANLIKWNREDTLRRHKVFFNDNYKEPDIYVLSSKTDEKYGTIKKINDDNDE